MRLFENLALFTMLLGLAWSFAPEKRRPRTILYLPLLIWALLAVHIIVEGARWQMVPAYLFALGLTLNNLRLLRRKQPAQPLHPFLRLLLVALFLVLFLVIYQLPQILPVFTLPDPGGRYAVGTTSLTLVDSARAETFTANPDDQREVAIRIWYPADPAAKARPARYGFDHADYAGFLAAELGLPPMILSHLRLVKTHSLPDVPLAADGIVFPVVLFSHGYRLGYLEQNTSLMETLASNGYVVISLAHPYEAIAAPLADGSTARLLSAVKDRFMESAVEQEKSLQVWAADTRFVMDMLESIQPDSPLALLAGRLDLEHLGLAGMSFGGSTAALVCLEDSRCKAGLTLDSPQYSAVEAGEMAQPFLFMVSDNGQYLKREVYERATGVAYLVTVKGTEHYNFTDLTLISPMLAALDFSGPIDGQQMVRILNAYPLAFFDKHLKGLPASLLNGISAEYPEVLIESRNTQ